MTDNPRKPGRRTYASNETQFPNWKSTKIIKLKPAGPKKGQTVREYLFGKSFADKRWSKKAADKGFISHNP